MTSTIRNRSLWVGVRPEEQGLINGFNIYMTIPKPPKSLGFQTVGYFWPTIAIHSQNSILWGKSMPTFGRSLGKWRMKTIHSQSRNATNKEKAGVAALMPQTMLILLRPHCWWFNRPMINTWFRTCCRTLHVWRIKTSPSQSHRAQRSKGIESKITGASWSQPSRP